VGANGVLAAWTTGAANGVGPIPIPPGVIGGAGSCAPKTGLYDGDVLNFDVTTTTGSARMMAVLGGVFHLGTGDVSGGCNSGTADSARTFLAQIQPDGSIAWQTATDYTMLFPNKQLRAIGINQKIYAVGGVIDSQVTNKSFSSYIDSTLALKRFVGSNYLESTTALPTERARASHGLEIITIDDTSKTPPVPRPIAYLFGGTNSATALTYRNDVMTSFIGLDDDIDDENAAYASPGDYVSRIYPLRGPGNITEVRWSASITRTASLQNDIKVEYRVANSAQLMSAAQWRVVDGDAGSASFSIDGSNVGLDSLDDTGTFIQYKATLTTAQPNNRESTPVFRGTISVKYTIDGHPSLFVKSGSFPTITPLTTVVPTIIISNAKPPQSTSTETVLDANIESSGSFFVDLYVYAPGQPVVPPTRNASGSYPLTSAAFAEISKNALPNGSELNLATVNWRLNCGPVAPSACPLATWQVIFNKEGPWTVIAVVDSGNNVTEADNITDPWESDNTLQFTVVSQVKGGTQRLPIAMRNAITPP
ncbi:MAG: hypothetical protein H0T53_00245, partial [Herpetosiphonaceae bacterium]|nr:hypothetical protein [Herpetosiphonaceae bacterium]